MKNILLISLLIFLISCESVIEPDLKNVKPQLVIEGEVTNQPGPYIVKLSKTTNFTAKSEFVGVENAFVVISDDMGTVDTLTMSEPGIYQTTKIVGTPNHNYTLQVVSENKTYTSQSNMPTAVTMDTVLFINQNINGQTISFLTSIYIDPADVKNQYRFKVSRNDEFRGGVSITNDDFSNGTLTQNTLAVFHNELEVGDSIIVNFMCIDKKVYDYFFSLSLTLGAQGAVPANPVSNISGGCLGYFSAHTLETKKINIE